MQSKKDIDYVLLLALIHVVQVDCIQVDCVAVDVDTHQLRSVLDRVSMTYRRSPVIAMEVQAEVLLISCIFACSETEFEDFLPMSIAILFTRLQLVARRLEVNADSAE